MTRALVLAATIFATTAVAQDARILAVNSQDIGKTLDTFIWYGKMESPGLWGAPDDHAEDKVDVIFYANRNIDPLNYRRLAPRLVVCRAKNTDPYVSELAPISVRYPGWDVMADVRGTIFFVRPADGLPGVIKPNGVRPDAGGVWLSDCKIKVWPHQPHPPTATGGPWPPNIAAAYQGRGLGK